MVEITKYMCEKCGQCYPTSTEAAQCEVFHVDVNGNPQYQYNPQGMGPESKYPHAITITMTDGTKLTFKR